MIRWRKRTGAAALLLACVATPAVGRGAGRVVAQSSADPAAPRGVSFVTAEELKAKLAGDEPVTILDVRTVSTYTAADASIKGAIRIKLRKLRSRLGHFPLRDLPRDREVVTYCACADDEAGIRAAEILLHAGFNRVRTLKGGWEAWLAAGGPIEPRPNR